MELQIGDRVTIKPQYSVPSTDSIGVIVKKKNYVGVEGYAYFVSFENNVVLPYFAEMLEPVKREKEMV